MRSDLAREIGDSSRHGAALAYAPGVWAAVIVLLATLSAAPAGPPIPVIDGGETPADVVAQGLTFYADGDYQRAATWLSLVVFANPGFSSAADLALADMYERGLGVPQDLRHAYALYLHAGSSTTDSYATQQLGRAALTRLLRELPDDDVHAATQMASQGFRAGLTPQWLPLASGGTLELTPEHLLVVDGAVVHEQPWDDFTMAFERVSMHPPDVASHRGRDLLEVLFWRTGERDGRTERTLFWRVYGIERSGIGILCETPLLTTHGFLVLLPSSFATDLRSRALLRITSTGEATCEPARDGISPP